ncbi:MAG: hypothetical protein KOO69_00290 [Victivallales bacterium]|nr:hypothetical protein [Victivallales bacterium]
MSAKKTKIDKPKKEWNWEAIQIKTNVLQNIIVVFTAIIGIWWALVVFYAEGKNITAVNISIVAKQLKVKGSNILGISVNITGAHRLSYKYDFRKSYLAVIKVTPKGLANHDFQEFTLVKPKDVVLHKDNTIFIQTSQNNDITSMYKIHFPFIVSVSEPGIYFIAFIMPSSGELNAKTNISSKSFSGTTKSIYINVLDQNERN